MSRRTKFGLVLGGYAFAYLNRLFTKDAASQASAGMAAFGDFILFIGIFSVLVLLPTGVALYFLLRNILRQYCPKYSEVRDGTSATPYNTLVVEPSFLSKGA